MMKPELVEITAFGDSTPRYILAFDPFEAEMEKLKARFIGGELTVETFEALLDEVIWMKVNGAVETRAGGFAHYT